MIHGGVVTLFVPVDRDGFDVVYRKFRVKNVDVTSVSKSETQLYVFYDRAKFFLGLKRVPPFKLREGTYVVLGDTSPEAEELTLGIPVRGAMRAVSAEHFISGSLKVHHTRLILK